MTVYRRQVSRGDGKYHSVRDIRWGPVPCLARTVLPGSRCCPHTRLMPLRPLPSEVFTHATPVVCPVDRGDQFSPSGPTRHRRVGASGRVRARLRPRWRRWALSSGWRVPPPCPTSLWLSHVWRLLPSSPRCMAARSHLRTLGVQSLKQCRAGGGSLGARPSVPYASRGGLACGISSSR